MSLLYISLLWIVNAVALVNFAFGDCFDMLHPESTALVDLSDMERFFYYRSVCV